MSAVTTTKDIIEAVRAVQAGYARYRNGGELLDYLQPLAHLLNLDLDGVTE